MATQLLIYETATPLNARRHVEWSIVAGKDYSFSSKVNSVPLMAVEILNAAAEYPVVFGGSGDAVMPAVILGLRTGENLYLDADGGWRARYVPAFLRRYPFVFSSNDEGKTFALCVDEGFPGFNQKGEGERLFNEEGKPTPYVDNVLKFLQQYQAEFARTEVVCKKLKTLNLLEPMQAQVRLDNGERISLTGFSVIDRARLKTLSSDALADLVKSDELELIYAHLASMRNFAGMKERLLPGAEAAPSGPDGAPGASVPGDATTAATDDAPAKPGKKR